MLEVILYAEVVAIIKQSIPYIDALIKDVNNK